MAGTLCDYPTDSKFTLSPRKKIIDLINYIQYNNFEVTDSKIYFVFDYLYSQYMEARKSYLQKHKKVSEYESENLMYPATHIDFLLYNRFGKEPVLALEVDGYDYHKAGTQQASCDELKNHILVMYGIPLLRFKTNGSGEKGKIIAV